MRAALRLLALATGLAAAAAHAQYGFTTQDANVRAGPERDYPMVAWLPVGSVVQIAGCLPDWRWCDVIAGHVRGFVYAGFLGYPYEGGYVVVSEAGPYLGLAVVPFVLETYWTTWYYDRPWYPRWSWWAQRPRPEPHPRPPQRPPIVRPLPPGQAGSQGIVPPLDLAIPPIRQPVEPFEPARPPGPGRPAGRGR